MSSISIPPGFGINTNPAPTAPEGFTVIGDSMQGVTESVRPDGSIQRIGVRIGLDGPEDAAEKRQARLLSADPASFTATLEKEIKQLTEQYMDHSGFDKEGNPLWVVTDSKARDIIAMKVATRQSALRIAQRDRLEAEAAQAAAKHAEVDRFVRIEQEAAVRAEEIARTAEVEKRAHAIAKQKYGVGK